MTIASEANRSGPYACNGATTGFPYAFKIFDEAHVRVILTDAGGAETTLALGTDYVVTGVGADGGGAVQTAVAHPTGCLVTLILNVPFTQGTDLENQGAYFAETIERALDVLTQQALQLKELIGRSVVLPVTSTVSTTDLVSATLALAEIQSKMEALVDIAPDIQTVAGIAADVVAAQGNAQTATTAAAIASTKAGEAAASAVAAAGAADRAEVAAATVEGVVSYAVEQDLTAEEKAQAQANLGLEGLRNALTPFGFTATAGQTAFDLGMSPLPSACIFSLNGAWLTGSGVDYTVAGSTLALTTPAEAGDRIAGVAIAPFTVANAMLSAANLADLANVAVARGNLGLGSAAVLDAGTGANQLLKLDGTGKIPPVDGSRLTGLPLSRVYESEELILVPASTFTLSHGLGVKPRILDVVMVCKTVEYGFSVDDEYRLSGVIVGSNNTPLVSLTSSSTEITGCFQSSGAYTIMHKTTRAWSTPTFANWRLKIRAFA